MYQGREEEMRRGQGCRSGLSTSSSSFVSTKGPISVMVRDFCFHERRLMLSVFAISAMGFEEKSINSAISEGAEKQIPCECRGY